MLKKKGTKIDFQTLNNLMFETVNEGLPYDKTAEKCFSKEEFNAVNQDYRMFGTLFGMNYLSKLIDLVSDNNKEDKEN